MSAKIALWLGVVLMGVGVADSYFNGATMLGLSFPIGSTLVFYALHKIDAA